jgi:hypothetical protein
MVTQFSKFINSEEFYNIKILLKISGQEYFIGAKALSCPLVNAISKSAQAPSRLPISKKKLPQV